MTFEEQLTRAVPGVEWHVTRDGVHIEATARQHAAPGRDEVRWQVSAEVEADGVMIFTQSGGSSQIEAFGRTLDGALDALRRQARALSEPPRGDDAVFPEVIGRGAWGSVELFGRTELVGLVRQVGGAGSDDGVSDRGLIVEYPHDGQLRARWVARGSIYGLQRMIGVEVADRYTRSSWPAVSLVVAQTLFDLGRVTSSSVDVAAGRMLSNMYIGADRHTLVRGNIKARVAGAVAALRAELLPDCPALPGRWAEMPWVLSTLLNAWRHQSLAEQEVTPLTRSMRAPKYLHSELRALEQAARAIGQAAQSTADDPIPF